MDSAVLNILEREAANVLGQKLMEFCYLLRATPESHLFPKYRRNLPVNGSHQS